MTHTSFSHKNTVRVAIGVVLAAAILLGLLLPAADMVRHKPENPLQDDTIRDITVLQVGEDETEQDSIVVPNGGSAAPEEPDEEDPDQPGPEEPTEEDSREDEPVPEDPKPEQPKPDETHKPSDKNQGDDGNDDGDDGPEGGAQIQPELAAVLTWYKYGIEPQEILCSPSGSAGQSVNTAQLPDGELRYEIQLTGRDARKMEITSVTLSRGDVAPETVLPEGSVEIDLSNGAEREYTFRVQAAADGQELEFAFVLRCSRTLDLELALTWQPNEGTERTIFCAPYDAEAFTVRSYDLHERVFRYGLKLTGTLAEDARITGAAYTTASGTHSGSLSAGNGTLVLDPAPNSDEETYYITVTAEVGGQEVTYDYRLRYSDELDVQLAFHWMEKGTTRRTLTCLPDDSVSQPIKNNQLSAGAVPYQMELTGKDGAEGRILSVSCTSDANDSGNLQSGGSLAMQMPEGASSNTYRISVSAMVKGKRVSFEVVLHYSADVSLQMAYSVTENGTAVTRQVTCENGKSRTAEAVYDNQLTDGVLNYTMSLVGSEAGDLSITSVSCYQSGSGRTVVLGPEGQLKLLLKDGKTGENSFEIRAVDQGGMEYRFSINVPYKHRGDGNIRISVNLKDGQTIINETKTNLTVKAWSENADGTVTGYIPANGVDTKLIVTFDGQVLTYVSSSGASSEYDLVPANPETGDTNTHTLHIYAEDAYGNFGELTLTLNGQRSDSGQKIGDATIYVDLSVLGLGVVASVPYEVLADEPVSYVIAKAIMGQDLGAPYGAAKESLGWSAGYAGTLDSGFYLQSLNVGVTGTGLEDSRWPGSTEAEVLQAIDDRFGAGTGMAALWRCLYRNGLNKSSGGGSSVGEFDYTSGSGWMYSIGGTTYYPGQAMSGVYLQDGDVLTLRYTLAYGWDVGGGSPGYGSTVGYCVTAVNGSIRVSHRMEKTLLPDGSEASVCRCCGIVEVCTHENVRWTDLGDGTHSQYCGDCEKYLGDPEEHVWVYDEANADDSHVCSQCGASESHYWRELEGSNTATCTEGGTRKVRCTGCEHIREEETGPKGHTLDNRWYITAEGHYVQCSTCGNRANEASHGYEHMVYLENGVEHEDYVCAVCDAFHMDECGAALRETAATCEKINFHCDSCGHSMSKEGVFDAYHAYTDGSCIHCGKPEKTEESGDDPEPESPT